MAKYTGTIILFFLTLIFGLIGAIFGVDTILSVGYHATISEYVHNWIFIDPLRNGGILIGCFATFIAGLVELLHHLFTFKPDIVDKKNM